MYIIKKKINGRDYYYLRKSVREGKKVISKSIAYLGKDKKEAERKAKEIIEKIKNKKQEKEEMLETKEKKENKLLRNIEDLASFCKRKGFVFPSSEIYGGFAGFWDFGHLGVELFNNIKKSWWDYFVNRENMVGIEASIISHPRTWIASGHVSGFKDIAVVCKKCKKSTKLEVKEFGKIKCECGGEYEKTGEFNLLFKTQVGALTTQDSYLRGETAQGMFMDFKLVYDAARKKLPFGIAQIGKCFRNEIAPRDFLFRSREFTIGEFEFFIHPDEEKCNLLEKKHLSLKINLLDKETQERGISDLKGYTIKEMLEKKKLGEWHAYWLAEQLFWFFELGLDKNKLKIREHKDDERAFYSSATFDIDYEYPFGSLEIAGNANRGQYDLNQHIKESKQDLSIFDEKTGKKIIPKVIEPTFGIERVFLAVLCNSYEYNEKRQNIVLKLPVRLAPIKAAVFPIVKDERFVKIAREVYLDLKKEFNVVYDDRGSLGRRYARMDEAGCPFCVTIDGSSLKKKDVTIRLRDTTEQVRVKIKEIKEILRKGIEGEDILKLGKKVNTRVKEV